MATAKLFWSGHSQAVRLPKAFRIQGDQCSIQWEGNKLILQPLSKRPFSRGFWRNLGELSEDVKRPRSVPQKRKRFD